MQSLDCAREHLAQSVYDSRDKHHSAFGDLTGSIQCNQYRKRVDDFFLYYFMFSLKTKILQNKTSNRITGLDLEGHVTTLSEKLRNLYYIQEKKNITNVLGSKKNTDKENTSLVNIARGVFSFCYVDHIPVWLGLDCVKMFIVYYSIFKRKHRFLHFILPCCRSSEPCQ